eukprot:Mycagemm_TRINITY_DN8921_c0_g1::TRINITY_DN8921_c0_g1_i1::g.5633::m.5633 type:complete len:125 gc:universal TRINITY_DN8921_c0_g1_i1:698-324(-)
MGRQDAIGLVRHRAYSGYTINLVCVVAVVFRTAGWAISSLAPSSLTLTGTWRVANFARLFVGIALARMSGIAWCAPSVRLAVGPVIALAFRLRGRSFRIRKVTYRHWDACRGARCTRSGSISAL